LKKIILFIVLLYSASVLHSQIIDKDTSDVVIRKTKKEKPTEYNISDVILKLDKEQTKYVIRVDLDIPLRTTLKLSVSDTSGNTIMYLINDQTLSPGVYRVRWVMVFCRTNDCDYPPGRYLCAFETDQFVFQRDFYLK
jgi:methionine-rich copper-binding protein CopC